MRISDWSSDVCSSDLLARLARDAGLRTRAALIRALAAQDERDFYQPLDLHRLSAAHRGCPAPFPHRAQSRLVEALEAAALRDGNGGDRDVDVERQRKHYRALFAMAPALARIARRSARQHSRSPLVSRHRRPRGGWR